jgi:hypothetical protein
LARAGSGLGNRATGTDCRFLDCQSQTRRFIGQSHPAGWAVS